LDFIDSPVRDCADNYVLCVVIWYPLKHQTLVTGPPCSVEAVVRERDGCVGERIESTRQDVLQTESLTGVHIDLHNIPSRTL